MCWRDLLNRFPAHGTGDQLIRDGVVADQAALARLGHVTRARLTQIMNLLALAPDIQEQLLFLPLIARGKDPITNEQARNIAKLSGLKAAATFSVPGAGKTTEGLALFFLRAIDSDKLLVIAPKNAFGAWDEQLENLRAGIAGLHAVTRWEGTD